MASVHSQQPPLTAKELVETTDLKAHLEELEKGEIVILNRPETESGNELNVIMTVLIPAPLKKNGRYPSAAIYRRDGGPGILAMGEIKGMSSAELDKAFARVGLAPEEKGEVDRMMEIQPDEDFNFSIDDIALIKKTGRHAEGGREGRQGPPPTPCPVPCATC